MIIYKENDYLIQDDYAILITNSKTYGVFKSFIDIEDIDKIKKYYWGIRYDRRSPKHYIETWVKGKRIHLHRFLLGLNGEYNPNETVDHINGDSLDNRKNNLKICSKKENSQNRTNPRRCNKNSISGIVGITWVKQHNKWRVNRNGKYLGQYKTLEKAKEVLQKYLLNNSEIMPTTCLQA